MNFSSSFFLLVFSFQNISRVEVPEHKLHCCACLRYVVLYAAGLDSECSCRCSGSLPEQISKLFDSTFIMATTY
jgi:hypothetical protein